MLPAACFATPTFVSAESRRRIAIELEAHCVPAFEMQDLARLVGRRDLEAELVENRADLLHLLRVGRGELALVDPQAVLETHAHVAAELCGLTRNRHLVPSRPEHRPLVRVTKKTIGRPLH